jgi:hypothetical protein
MKMGRRLSRGRGIGYLTIRICAHLAPCRRPILIATKATLLMGQDTRLYRCQELIYPQITQITQISIELKISVDLDFCGEISRSFVSIRD